ncbi:MAG: ABC transporter permease [Candidatus Rokubacteria bacterium]|nr:ABC transporter permease [Candidatus Rokubacteria bacterium]
MTRVPGALGLNACRVLVVAAILAVWEWAFPLNARYDWLIPDFLDPYFVSRPSEIWARFVRLACLVDRAGAWTLGREGAFAACLAQSQNNLWIGTLVTLKNTFWGFVAGVGSGVMVGLALGRSELLATFFEPFIVAVNSIPRIALVPFIILLFGLGDISKIVTAWVIVFFVVFFNTFEGARAVDRDHIAVARLFGASRWQVTATVIVPSTMAWVFASLTPAISFSLIGVIVGEFIGAERGVGKIIVEAEARAQAADMMVALFVLMVVGVVLALAIRRTQSYLLRWQAHFQGRE